MPLSAEKHPKRVTLFESLAWILTDLCKREGFSTAVLIGPEGLPLARSQAGGDEEAEAVAAVTDLLHRAARQVKRQLSWSDLDEIRIVTQGKQNLIAQAFLLDNEEVILAVVLSDRVHYRQAIQQAIDRLQFTWAIHQQNDNASKAKEGA